MARLMSKNSAYFDADEEEVVASFDLNADGVPDVEIKDTNGHTVYINVKWLIGLVTAGASAIIGLLVVV